MTYDATKQNHLFHDGLGDPETCDGSCGCNHPADLMESTARPWFGSAPWWARTYHRRTVRRVLAALAAVLVLLGVGLGYAAGARADAPGCMTQFWWTIGSTQRTLCDGPVQPDGSWHRWREFWTPAHQVPLSCSTYGGIYYASTSCTGGYFQQRTTKGIEDYPVTPDTVLPDEPGHIG